MNLITACNKKNLYNVPHIHVVRVKMLYVVINRQAGY